MKLQPREKKMVYALLGVAVVGAFILFRPDGKEKLEEIGNKAVDQFEETTAKREQAIQKATQDAPSGGGGGRRSSGGGATTEIPFEQHNSLKDCWVIFQGKIYDITKMIENYPGGGARLEQHCGTRTFEENFNFEKVMSVEEFLEIAEYKGEYFSQ